LDYKSFIEVYLMQPIYTHDCPKCTFLGNYEETVIETKASDPFYSKTTVVKYDLYCCDGFYRSIIARSGNDCGEYYSEPEYCIADRYSGSFELDPTMDQRAIYRAWCLSKKVKYSFRVWRNIMLKKYGRICRYDTRRERVKLALVNLLTLVDIAVYFLTFTIYETSFHSKLLFSDFMEEE
jgi:hypothetical protein